MKNESEIKEKILIFEDEIKFFPEMCMKLSPISDNALLDKAHKAAMIQDHKKITEHVISALNWVLEANG